VIDENGQGDNNSKLIRYKTRLAQMEREEKDKQKQKEQAAK